MIIRSYGYEELELELKERKETQEIVGRITGLIGKICEYIVKSNENILKTIFRTIRCITFHLLRLTSRISGELFSPRHKNDLEEYLIDFREVKEALRDCVSFGIWNIVTDTGVYHSMCSLSSIDMPICLESKLNGVRKAHYAPGEACLTDTREDLLASVIPWVVNM